MQSRRTGDTFAKGGGGDMDHCPGSVLVVHPDAPAREELSALLFAQGYSVATAADLRQVAARIAWPGLPDVVLLSVATARSVAGALVRAFAQCGHAVRVVLLCDGTPAPGLLTYATGALLEPPNPAALLRTVGVAVGQRPSGRSLWVRPAWISRSWLEAFDAGSPDPV